MLHRSTVDLLTMPKDWEERPDVWKDLTVGNGLFRSLCAAVRNGIIDKAKPLLAEWYDEYIQYGNRSECEWDIAYAMLKCAEIATLSHETVADLPGLLYELDPCLNVPDVQACLNAFEDMQSWRQFVYWWLYQVSWQPSLGAAWAWDVTSSMWDIPRPIAQVERVTVPLMIGKGTIANLTLELLSDLGNGELYPDPKTMSFVTRNEAFRQAEENAAAYVRAEGLREGNAKPDIRWRLERQDGRPFLSVEGGSAGGAFALGQTKLLVTAQKPSTDNTLNQTKFHRTEELDLSGVTITAQIQPDGTFLPVNSVFEKLIAASRERAFPRIRIAVVAKEQPIADFNLLSDLRSPQLFQELGFDFWILCAGTLAEAIELLVEINQKRGDSRDFYHHINMPHNYIPHPALLTQIRDQLLDNKTDLGLTSAIKIKMNALHGMGGIGKSVMARALCEDAKVQSVFPDGILWATLGQNPDVRVHLREWIHVLGGVVRETAPTVDMLKNTLAMLLSERACLLILDDVWKRTHVETFCVGGPRCRLIFTTREAEIASDLGATLQQIPPMDLDAAMGLLSTWAGDDLNREIKAQIVQRLGHLPLAIKLAGAQLSYQNDPTQWLATFNIHKLKYNSTEKIHDSLTITFGLSLADLDDGKQDLYTALAIFRENENIPTVAIENLWSALADVDTNEIYNLINDLHTRALLQLNPANSTSRDNNTATISGPTVSLHDLLRDFMSAKLGHDGQLKAHRKLLNAYRRRQGDEGWASVPDDGYLYDHLTYHLDQIADDDHTADADLNALFATSTWLYARVPQSNYEYDGYIADLTMAWQRVHTRTQYQLEASHLPSTFSDCIRYALIRTSINSLTSNYDGALVVRAVQTGLWPPNRALNLATRMPDKKEGFEIIVSVLQSGTIDDAEYSRAQRLGFEAALNLQDTTALSILAPYLPEAQVPVVLVAVIANGLLRNNKDLVTNLAPYLSQSLVQHGQKVASNVQGRESYANVMDALAPHLSGAQLDQMVEVALTHWPDGLSGLVPHLSNMQREQALETTLTMHDERNQAQMLSALAPHLSRVQLKQAASSVINFSDWKIQLDALLGLLPYLSKEEQQLKSRQGLERILTQIEESDEDNTLSAHAPAKVDVLLELYPYLPQEEQQCVLRQGLKAALKHINQQNGERPFLTLAPYLSQAQLQQALETILAFGDSYVIGGWFKIRFTLLIYRQKSI
ncbi:hypothetical protein KFU94_65905 [Chloroflexi bacterium TSY]|nr:hypothetical protein [Chloroflexi bacterium TSY]